MRRAREKLKGKIRQTKRLAVIASLLSVDVFLSEGAEEEFSSEKQRGIYGSVHEMIMSYIIYRMYYNVFLVLGKGILQEICSEILQNHFSYHYHFHILPPL